MLSIKIIPLNQHIDHFNTLTRDRVNTTSWIFVVWVIKNRNANDNIRRIGSKGKTKYWQWFIVVVTRISVDDIHGIPTHTTVI